MGICCCCFFGTCCFNTALTRTLEITLIVLNSLSFLFLLLCLAIIKWKEFPLANVLLFIIMLLFSLACLILSSILRYWRSVNTIKTTKKSSGTCLAALGLALSIIHFIACIIEEFVFIFSLRDIDIITSIQVSLAYYTFSYLEISLILNMIIWTILKPRIINGLDEPIPVEITPNHMYSPYGRAVIVIQQPGMAMNQNQINPAYIYNQQNNGAHIPGTSKGY